jgi:hypothetical protein
LLRFARIESASNFSFVKLLCRAEAAVDSREFLLQFQDTVIYLLAEPAKAPYPRSKHHRKVVVER